jgi:flagellar biosynthesis protein
LLRGRLVGRSFSAAARSILGAYSSSTAKEGRGRGSGGVLNGKLSLAGDIRRKDAPPAAKARMTRNTRPPGRTGRPPQRQQSVAVALQHTRGTEAAPRVVASGRGFTAERILELAFANGVKVREDADLAEMLTAVGIGEAIPFAAFAAVAEILSYLYRANQAADATGSQR